MGGKGTLQFALLYPQLFAKAAVLSFMPTDMEAEKESFKQLYDMNPSEVYQNQDVMHSTQRQYNVMHKYNSFEEYMDSSYNLWKKLAEADKEELPDLFFSVGTEDPLISPGVVEDFQAYLKQLGIEAIFETGPGSHEWRVWERDIQKAFDFFDLDHDTKGNAF